MSGAEVPDHDTDAVILRQPLGSIYLAASSAMDLFLQLDALDRIRMTSTTEVNWALPEVAAAMEDGSLEPQRWEMYRKLERENQWSKQKKNEMMMGIAIQKRKMAKANRKR